MSAAGLGACLVTQAWLAAHLAPAGAFHPYPTGADHAAWAQIEPAAARAIADAAAADAKAPWAALPASAYLEYARDGNRSHYEADYFRRRSRAVDFTLAETLAGDGRRLDAVTDGLWLLCEETSWTIPAHLGAQHAGVGLPDPNEPIIDLFAAETGAQVAWTDYLLGARLDRVSPQVRPRLHAEVERRILEPFLRRDDFGWMGLKHPEAPLNNWTPWIVSNVLTCAFIEERDPARRAEMAAKALVILDHYLAGQPDDGGCDEGPGYWHRAAASLFDALELVRQATGGQFDPFALPKIRAMARFIYQVEIADRWVVNFSDAEAKMSPEGLLIYRFGERVRDPAMQAFGAWFAQAAHRENRLEGGSLGRMIPDLLTEKAALAAPAALPLPRDVWWPDSKIMVARATAGKTQGIFVAAEAANNGKSHNHNDVGSCMVFLDGQPVLIDAGVGTYTRQTFSSQRYDIWTMQSAYHNLPTVNGQDEAAGRQFAARNVAYSAQDDRMLFSADLAGAYPAAARIASWVRSYAVERPDRVTISDRFSLANAPTLPVQRHFLLARQPRRRGAGQWSVAGDRGEGAALLTFSPDSRVRIESVDTRDPRLHAVWGDAVYRMTLTEPAPAAAGRLTFAVSRAEAINPKLPSLVIVGDSTSAADAGDIYGWGVPFPEYFDLSRINIVNRSRAGRSSRTYLNEGAWAKVVAALKPGDTVLIQMAHNDGSPVNDSSRARGTLPGLGEESQAIENGVTHQHEVVHTYGWYLRRYIADARAKGARPILLSPTVRNIWTGAKVERGPGHYAEWCRQLAAAEHVPFLDATTLIADRYEQMGPAAVGKLFPHDHTHTNLAGATLVASIIAGGLESGHLVDFEQGVAGAASHP